jgi:hypothetical protein
MRPLPSVSTTKVSLMLIGTEPATGNSANNVSKVPDKDLLAISFFASSETQQVSGFISIQSPINLGYKSLRR